MNEADKHWIVSKWTDADLTGKTVELRLQIGKRRICANGKFDVKESPPRQEKQIRIIIKGAGADEILYLPQQAEPLIIENAAGASYNFSLFEW
jgi:UDP-N-acetylglucosamine transferase subunit ALG13